MIKYLRYFISWLSFVLSTVSIIVLFLLLITFIKHFDNPGGIYFYLYFIFIPLWFLLGPIYTIIGCIILERKKGFKTFFKTLSVNVLTGILGLAGIIFLLVIETRYVSKKRAEKINLFKSNMQIQDVQYVKNDVDNDGKFDHLMVRYTLNANMDVGEISTFTTVSLDNGDSFPPFIMTNDDIEFNRVQSITKGNWVCELSLKTYNWDQTSQQRLIENSKAPKKQLIITVREESHTERLPEELIKNVIPVSLDFENLDTKYRLVYPPGVDKGNNKKICTKVN